MLDLNAAAIFVCVVHENGFTAAAKSLGLPKQTVSRKVAELEDELGVRLLERSTRRLRLTAQGAKFFAYAQQISSLATTAAQEVRATQEEPEGVLRISAPPLLGDLFIRKMILLYMKLYPKVKIESRFYIPEQSHDLLSENIDIEFRVGVLPESSMIAKRVAPSWSSFFATPEYLARYGTPQSPEDIRFHSCIHYEGQAQDLVWSFQSQDQVVDIPIEPRISTTSFWLAKDVVCAGHGIGRLPWLLCIQECRSGELVQVLKEYQSPSNGIYAVYPSRKLLSIHIRKFLDLIDQYRDENPIMKSNSPPRRQDIPELYERILVHSPQVITDLS
jgi:DNA-binding transcriptional LysR family regulator